MDANAKSIIKMKLKSGKLNIVIDGQFGSTGKGLLSSYVAVMNHIDIAITDASANAGHTFYYHGKKHVVKHLPVSGIIHTRNQIYLCAGAIINPVILLDEIEKFDVDPCRIAIHPRCAIIEQEDIDNESQGKMVDIASTQSGVGSALVRKINRTSKLAKDCDLIKHMVKELDLQMYMDYGCTLLMEVPQGYDLSISSGLSYPYCTSREITISAALSDAQVHPAYLGKVAVCIRTFPIRVGNGDGYSGPFYPDSIETNWDIIGVEAERTTVTNKIRRVATFSFIQYSRMIKNLKPDYILLNFVNYLKKDEYIALAERLPEVTHIGIGPKIIDVKLNHW